MGKWLGRSNKHEDLNSQSETEGPGTPEHAYGAFHKQPAPPSPPSDSSQHGGTALSAASSLLHKVPGAKTVSLLNATVLGLLGLGAALAACGGGCTMLLVLLARWYLPAQETHHMLPLYMDYAAGPSAAGAWVPLLRNTPLTATLTPPSHQRPPPAASGISMQGSFSLGADSGFGSQLGFLGLGFGPGSRAVARQSSRGWLGRSKGARQQRSSSSGAARGVDVGSGVVVPEGDWLVPLWGRLGLQVELEVPRWPESDLVQVTCELVSQQGIVLGRTTRTWVPKPRPLLYRIADTFIFGPWRALGLLDSSLRVSLPMFEGFQNPQPPPGGWGSVLGLGPGKKRVTECASPAPAGGSSSGSGKAAAESGGATLQEDAEVSGPRAMWLRVTMIGRSVGYGPPKVYRATAKLDMRLSFLDRLAVALRPSLLTVLLLLVTGVGLAVGGTGTAAVLLLLAYSLYRWASSVSQPDGQYGDGTAEAPAGASHEGGELQEEESAEGFYEPGYENEFAQGFEGSSLSAAGAGEFEDIEPEQSSMHAGDPEVARGKSPASVDETYEDIDYAGQSHLEQQQQQWQQKTSSTEQHTGDHHAEYRHPQQAEEYAPSGSATKPHGGSSSGKGAVGAIKRMFGYAAAESSAASSDTASRRGWGQEATAWQEQEGPRGAAAAVAAASAEDALLHDAGVSGLPADAGDEWQEELLADSDDEQQCYHDAADAAAAQKEQGLNSAQSAGQEHSSQTGAGPSRRAGFNYHL